MNRMITTQKHSYNKDFKEYIPFFPQIRPEKKVIALTKEEKIVLDILKKEKSVLLNDFKIQSGLNNKKWDKTVKGLTKNKMAKVLKINDNLFVETI